jgi:precorrin-6Y C5,15-methyltransferase (decarboxylating) CbiT subunit
VPPDQVVAVFTAAPTELREELVVVTSSPFTVQCRIAGWLVVSVTEQSPPYRLAELQLNRLGEHVSDRRTASPTTSTLGTAPDSVGQTAANAVARLGLPHPSSVSLAAARPGSPLDDVDVVSLVGRPLELLHPLLQPGRRVFALGAAPSAAAEVRALLDARGFGTSPVTVLAHLVGPTEAVGPADGRPHRLAIIAIECRLDTGAAPLPRSPGLPDDAFEPGGQITKREIRALALVALAPIPGQLLWDVGAGSGSIGIERMRTHPASRAIAVEPRADRRDRITRNAAALGVPGLLVVPGSAPGALHGLPRCSSAAASRPRVSWRPAWMRLTRAGGWWRTRSPSRARSPWRTGGVALAAA